MTDMTDMTNHSDPSPNQPETAGGSAISPVELERITDDIVAALKTVYDPEIPADIYELGLVYRIDIDDDRLVTIDMTLTAPGCPVAGEMPGWVENAVGVGARRLWRQGEHGVRSAVDARPDERGSPGRHRLVLSARSEAHPGVASLGGLRGATRPCGQDACRQCVCFLFSVVSLRP